MSGAGDRNRLSTLGAALGIVAGAVAATFLAVVTYRAFETPRTVNRISSAGSSGGMTPNGDKMDSSKPSEPVSEPVPVEEPMSEPASSAAHRNPLYKPLSGIPELLFGAGIFSGSYGDLESDPAATVRRALYLGITFFDTSVLYGESESILGEALQKNAAEYPREKYYIATKCGRYGYKTSDCDFTGKRTRESVMRSLERLRTSYLDIVYAHDVEFAPSLEAVLGEGGILLELFKMKEEGLIGHVGISGYPLPVLLAIAEHQHSINQPLDVLLSYCHFNLQNSSLASFVPKIRAAGVKTVISASPICMGILGDRDLPVWHPAPEEMRKAREEASRWCMRQGWALGNLALRYALRNRVKEGEGRWDATLVGLRGVDEVENAAMHFDQVNLGFKGEVEFESTVMDDVRGIFEKRGMKDFSWTSPSDREMDHETAIGRTIR